MPVLTAKYAGKPESVTTSQDWLILEQQQVPQSQQICTVDNLRKMLNYAMTGQAVKSYVSDSCPAKRRLQGGKVIISYEATVLVHRSENLTQNYDLTPSDGRLSSSVTVQRFARRPYKLKNDSITFLKWLPATAPRISWLTRVYSDKKRVFAPSLPEETNGYLYFPETYKGEFEASGNAIVDRVSLTIDHQQGYQFDKTILLTAEWGPEDAQGNRASAQIEVKPPQCWIDEANKCADPDLFAAFGSSFGGDGTGEWNMTLNAGFWRVHIGFCSGKILKKERVLS